jgi:hypothetical protein
MLRMHDIRRPRQAARSSARPADSRFQPDCDNCEHSFHLLKITLSLIFEYKMPYSVRFLGDHEICVKKSFD